MDRTDRRILIELMRDSTIPIAELARRVNLSQTPCWKRVRKMEDTGIIAARVALADPDALGLGLIVFVELQALDHTPAWRAALDQLVAHAPEIMEAYRIAGDIDCLLKVAVADMAGYDRFYGRLANALPCRRIAARVSAECLKATTVCRYPATIRGSCDRSADLPERNKMIIILTFKGRRRTAVFRPRVATE